MSSDVEEHQEVVDKYYYAPSQNKIAPARQLAHIEYSKELVKIQRNDRDQFTNFVQDVSAHALQDITQVMGENIQKKLNDLHIEVNRKRFSVS